MKRFLVSGLAALLITLVCSCGAKKEKQVDIKELVAQKCSMCHFSERIYKDPRAPREWEIIVGRMRALNPQLLSREEAANITKYLQENVSN